MNVLLPVSWYLLLSISAFSVGTRTSAIIRWFCSLSLVCVPRIIFSTE